VLAVVAVVALGACPAPKDGLPCDVAELVSKKCSSCHGVPPQNAAPQSLMTLAHFTAPSALDPQATYAQRSLVRMKQTAAPMPPAYAPQLTPQELDAFERWVTAGAPAGTCETDPDAGLGFDAGPPPLTCLSNTFAPRPTTLAPNGGDEMAPGLACNSCHRGGNFQEQNPFGALGMTRTYDAAGTVYGSPNEKDLCVSSVGDAGLVVEIIDSTGTVALSLPVGASGNFHGSLPLDAGVKLPYTARVVRGAVSRTMTTPQTEGDCNTCHTEYGREEAPGRIVAP
jgi:hypothetical protein